MPLKLNVGLSRKIGTANYGSRGASVNLELELDSSIVTAPERLQERIRQMFVLAKSSIEEELHASNTIGGAGPRGVTWNGSRSPTARPMDARTTSENSYDARRSGTPTATTSQVRALRAIAHRGGINLDARVQEQFGVSSPVALTIAQASELIDDLKSTRQPAGGMR